MRTTRFSAVPALVLSICGLLAPVLRAQEFRGKVQGMVTDSSQSVIIGAVVTLSNVNTGVKAVRQTNETGLYRFDYVDPGSYTVTIETTGFSRYLQQNVQVQAQADITVNAALKPGTVQETITVEASPVDVQFNSANVTMTIDTKLAEDLPRLDRNPFKLSLLNPAAVETRRSEMNPYQSWSANSIELGGGTDKKNDLLVDGSPIGVGHKASYVPNTDSIQEVNVQQNSVDAESGHSAGGTVSMTLKSGTNQLHGNLFYLGRNPSLNAVTDRTTGTMGAERRNMWGATVGHPIVRNKVFNFFSYEHWKPRTPGTFLGTMPTALERKGDFSQSLNANGALRTIYDPWTTVINASTGAVTRTPFAGNQVPSPRFDPLGLRVMKTLYEPNRSPDSVMGTNNFAAQTVARWNYINISDRADWSVNDSWRVYGRYSVFRTTQATYAPVLAQSEAYVPDGSARNSLSISGDAIWTVNATTVMNFHGDYHNFVDEYRPNYGDLGKERWAKIWPSNPWYAAFDIPQQASYFPRTTIGGTTLGQGSSFWFQHTNGNSFNVKISNQHGSHYLKAGFDTRRSGGSTLSMTPTWFVLNAAMTANTFQSPNTRLVGDEFATLLLGALGADTIASKRPVKQPRTEFFAGFFQDDYKLSRRITLNLGLRYEFDTPWHNPDYSLAKGLDLTQPIPEMQQNPPAMPAAASALMKTPYVFNGAWIWTDKSSPGMWKTQKTVFMPRLGMALRIDDRTALRIGYARYVAPGEMNFVNAPYTGFTSISFMDPPYMGFDAIQNPQDLIAGIPQSTYSDPFPAASNPLVAPPGKAAGRNFGLGVDNIVWPNANFQRLVNDRFNVTFSRQLPNQIVAEITYFMNFGRNVAYSWNGNQMDPQIGYTNKSAIDVSVANPFYQYLTSAKFPGSLRNQRTVSLKTLLKQYPQYGGLWQAYKSDGLERYKSLQFRVQRPFRGGYNFLVGYNYRTEKSSQFYDEVANHAGRLDYQDSSSGRQSLSIAGTYEFPFGKGRPHLQNLPRAVDGILGGWQAIGAWYFNSGNYLRFGSMIATGDPALPNPTPQKWFDTSKFAVLPAYTPRTNPWQYPDVKGPIYWEVQGTLSKTFRITERVRTELKVAAYNLTNRLNRADPPTAVTSSTFGQALRQNISIGRQLELGLKILF